MFFLYAYRLLQIFCVKRFQEIPHSLWFLAVTLDRKKERFLEFIQEQVQMSMDMKVLLSRGQ